MRLTRANPETEILRHAVTYLGALADQGQQTIGIRKMMELLGVEWREAGPSQAAPLPGVDPITGCAPVTAVQSRDHL